MVNTMVLAAGSTWRMARMASTPLITGSCKSISTTSGRSLTKQATASSPVATDPTTVQSGSRSMMSWRPSRTMRWSSTTRMRIGDAVIDEPPRLGLGEWKFREDLDAGSRRGFDRTAAACTSRPLPHDDQTVVARTVCRLTFRIEPPAIVGYVQAHKAIVESDLHLHS